MESVMMSRYLKIKGTIKKDDLKIVNKIMQGMYLYGDKPLSYTERRTYYYLKSDRQDEILQFAERSNLTYLMQYRGMTFKRSNNLREGAGGEYACSEEGEGLIREMGFIPVKRKLATCYQWSIGHKVFFKVYDTRECINGTKSKEIDSQKNTFEVYTFCDSLDVDSIDRVMRSFLEQFQPYLVVQEKKNMGC